MPWSPAREMLEGGPCRRMSFEDIDQLLHQQLSFSWNDIDQMGVHKVIPDE